MHRSEPTAFLGPVDGGRRGRPCPAVGGAAFYVVVILSTESRAVFLLVGARRLHVDGYQ